MFETILVPTDGSDGAADAARTAVALAARFDATLHAIHVFEPDELPESVHDDVTETLTQRGRDALETVSDAAAEAGVSVQTALLENGDSTHEAIVEYARENQADLLVMGTHGRRGLDQRVLGSVTERTLRTAPIPVLTVHDHDTVPDDADFESVLIPTDDSGTARAAAEYAIDLTADTDGTLHGIHVIDVDELPDAVDPADVLDALEAEGQQALETVISRARGRNVGSVEAQVLSGRPHEAILDYVGSRDVDLVVMGSHGRTGLDHYLLGSVAERIVREAPVPVLVIPRSEDTADATE